jgi:hypothetical protein
MARHSVKTREKAREIFLTGEISSIAEIARRLRVKPHTVATWKNDEGWDGLKLRIDKRAAEQLVERLATERVNLNTQHFKLWNAIIGRLFASIQKEGKVGADAKDLDRVSAILERAQKGQRLARGLTTDGQSEEQIRAEGAAETRHVVDTFLNAIKREVHDPAVRDRIARAVLVLVPLGSDEEETPNA